MSSKIITPDDMRRAVEGGPPAPPMMVAMPGNESLAALQIGPFSAMNGPDGKPFEAVVEVFYLPNNPNEHRYVQETGLYPSVLCEVIKHCQDGSIVFPTGSRIEAKEGEQQRIVYPFTWEAVSISQAELPARSNLTTVGLAPGRWIEYQLVAREPWHDRRAGVMAGLARQVNSGPCGQAWRSMVDRWTRELGRERPEAEELVAQRCYRHYESFGSMEKFDWTAPPPKGLLTPGAESESSSSPETTSTS